jgi:hypothetical protein
MMPESVVIFTRMPSCIIVALSIAGLAFKGCLTDWEAGVATAFFATCPLERLALHTIKSDRKNLQMRCMEISFLF